MTSVNTSSAAEGNAGDTDTAPLQHPDQLFIGGKWSPAEGGSTLDVIDSASEDVFYRAANASSGDVDRAVAAARRAFDEGPWPQLTHVERAKYVSALAAEIEARTAAMAEVWTRQSGMVSNISAFTVKMAVQTFQYYADLADTYSFSSSPAPGSTQGLGTITREPVGVVGAIIPWNGPIILMATKLGPALVAGCTVVLKAAPEAPGEALLVAEAAEAIGLPPGVLNVITADREASERLVTNTGVDKIAFTGSTAAGRRIASLLGERVGRYTLELGGKSPALILDDADIGAVAQSLSAQSCRNSGQICSALTRIIVSKHRHDELVEALVGNFGQSVVGNPFDSSSQLGPLAMERQRDRVEGYVERAKSAGVTLATGGSRPKHLDRGWYFNPTVFGNVDNGAEIAQEEIFGPVLSVIPANDEADMIRIANDTIYGLNSAVYTPDVERAQVVARQIRAGTVRHNGLGADYRAPFGGYKQSGVGREGGIEGLQPYLETKLTILDQPSEPQ